MVWTNPTDTVDSDVWDAEAANRDVRDNLGALKGSGSGSAADITLQSIVLAPSFLATGSPAKLIKALVSSAAQFRALAESSAIANDQQSRLTAAVGTAPYQDGNGRYVPPTQEDLMQFRAARDSSGTGILVARRFAGALTPVSDATMVFEPANELAIGKAAAGYPLDVYGTVKAGGFLQGGSAVGQWQSTYVTHPVHVGGPGDVSLATSMAAGVLFTGPAETHYVVEIEANDAAPTYGKFRWSEDSGRTWTAGVSVIPVGPATTIPLSYGVEIEFATSPGYATGDRWEFWGSPDPLMRFVGNASVSSQLEATANGVSSVGFDGAGIDDMEASISGAFAGQDGAEYVVVIDATGTPDTFAWSRDGGQTLAQSNVNISGTPQTLENGVQVSFPATTGHTEGDLWRFNAYRQGLLVHSRTLCSNLNFSQLNGSAWPAATLEASMSTATLTGRNLTLPVVQPGWYLVFAEATMFAVPDPITQGTYSIRALGRGDAEICAGGGYVWDSDELLHASAFGLADLVAGDEIILETSTLNTYTSGAQPTAQGSLTALWLAPPTVYSEVAMATTTTITAGGSAT